MKILIMGGTEFVSSSLARHLILKGHKVDIFTRGIKELTYSGVNLHLKGDRKSYDNLKRNLKDIKYEYIFDISAYSIDDVEKLLSVIDRDKLKRYIFCSSGAVYKPSDNIISENFETGYNNNWQKYGIDKLKAEEYLKNEYNENNLPVVIFRPTYIYGKNNNLYRECYLFDRLTSNKAIPIPSGDTLVQFIYIDDLLNVFESAMYEEICIGKEYNVTNPETISWSQLVKTAARVAGVNENIKLVPNGKVENSREYFPFRNCSYLLSIDKLIRDGLFTPNINIFEGLKKSYDWYINENPKLKDDKMKKIEYVLDLD